MKRIRSWLCVTLLLLAFGNPTRAALMDDMASYLNVKSSDGYFAQYRADPTAERGTFVGNDIPQSIHDGLTSYFGCEGATTSWTKDIKWTQDYPTFTGSEVSLDGPLGDPTSTPNEVIAEAIRKLLEEAKKWGLDTSLLEHARLKTDYHRAGSEAGGLTPSEDSEAVTITPGVTFYNGGIVWVYNGRSHITFIDAMANDLIYQSTSGGDFLNYVQGSYFPVTSADCALHETIHAMIHWENISIGSSDNEEAIVHSLTALINTKASVHVGLVKKGVHATASDIATYQSQYDGINNLTGGKAVMDKLGITRDQLNALVPEPTGLVSLGAGALSVLLLGLRRRRSR